MDLDEIVLNLGGKVKRMKGGSEVVGFGVLPKNSVTSASAANASSVPTTGALARKATLTALVHVRELLELQGDRHTPLRLGRRFRYTLSRYV